MAAALIVPSACATEVDMLDRDGLPCLAAETSDGTPLKLMIDTGDATSLLDAGKAKAMDLAVEPAKDKGGKVIDSYFIAHLKGLRLGQETLGDDRFLVMDMNKDIVGGTFPHSDGMIAYTDLRGKRLTLDYKRHVVGLSDAPAAAPCAAACGTIT